MWSGRKATQRDPCSTQENANDHKWHSAAEIVAKLVQIVSKGGNDLLNVGPTPEGTFPQPCIDRLAEVGR